MMIDVTVMALAHLFRALMTVACADDILAVMGKEIGRCVRRDRGNMAAEVPSARGPQETKQRIQVKLVVLKL